MSSVFFIKTPMSITIKGAMKLAIQSVLFTLLACGKLRKLIDSELISQTDTKNDKNMKNAKFLIIQTHIRKMSWFNVLVQSSDGG